MFGPHLLASSLTPPTIQDEYGNRWQYHPRSDRHSKIACWGLLLDLLNNCALMRKHAAEGLIGYGINHEMTDYRTNRKKNLDLVVCRPRTDGSSVRPRTFAEQAGDIGIALDAAASTALRGLPVLPSLPVGSVHIAVEAKACMTEFIKARPRMYDELNSSHAAIHGNSPHAIAAGLTMVNIAETFISPGRNPFDMRAMPARITAHKQPRHAEQIIAKLREIPRRVRNGEDGFDALAITVINCPNDGSPIRLLNGPPAPDNSDIYHYEMTVHRLAQLYEQRFRAIS